MWKKTIGKPSHDVACRVRFSLLTEDAIRNISVLRVVTPQTLSSSGHPVPGGLYDNRMGPSGDRSELCGTCYQINTLCAGHFGYIELPVPCENPLFHKVIGTILRYSCLSCGRFQLTEESRRKIDSIIEDNIELIDVDVMKLVAEEIKIGKSCSSCKKILDKIQVLSNRIVMVSRSSDSLSKVMSKGKIKAMESKYLNPSESQNYLRRIWNSEQELIKKIVPVLAKVDLPHPTDAFYIKVIPVSPTILRPVNFMDGRYIEHSQTSLYKSILTNALAINPLIKVVQSKGDTSVLQSQQASEFYAAARGASAIEKLNNCWEELQRDVNCLLSVESTREKGVQGLKQVIEKKEGVIRQHMMGKRVNFAARSVITPDPNLNISEVGIPEEFAKKLTCPVPVTPWNVEYLRELIRNGPGVHPGAVYVETEEGLKREINPLNKVQQESLLKTLLTPQNERKQGFQGIKIVHRHLQNGDILLLNRQPTLHKPSIMAHRARVLKGEKTLRLHYSNCKAYNADFDGDEMNAHFPQDDVSRSEAYNLVEVAQQYLVPKDGTPLSGLIQDHIIAGVQLSIRGRFFTRIEYQQLVYQGLSHKVDKIILLPPAIIKPEYLWSGKQIMSTIIKNIIPKGKQCINLTSTSKISAKAWEQREERPWKAGGTPFNNGKEMSEAEVIIRDGELLSGVLDKNHFGPTPYGLGHCMYELYGGKCAVQLLSSLSKLFTSFLKSSGFTLGVRDILTEVKADKKRKKAIKKLRQVGKKAIANALGVNPEDHTNEQLADMVQIRCSIDSKFRQVIDRSYKSLLDPYTNKINKYCVPMGLIERFPKNNLQLMVQSGAKGSTVNTMQISCLLGQVELEGKRPPVMISGKSLPSFPVFEFAPRAGGFIDGRFMTSIRPQEFFFHCMAGREGLIDTAVKTSRSGYLQRCLIKHLEGLYVGYDLTVRNSDQRVIQFLYGEDGMDICKSQFFNEKQMQFLLDNAKCIIDKDVINQLKEDDDREVLQAAHHYETLNDRLNLLLTNSTKDKSKKERHDLKKVIKLKRMESMAAPGEPVGLLAAQSIGEPSTQMTLNTFHFAGRGDMNVTLGIPRLREILMMASKKIKTPSMEIPFKNVPDLSERALHLKKRLTRVLAEDILERIDVNLKLELEPVRQYKYTLDFYFLPPEFHKDDYNVTAKSVFKAIKKLFFKQMFIAILKLAKVRSNLVQESKVGEYDTNLDSDDEPEDPNRLKDNKKRTTKGDDSSDDEVEDIEDAKLTTKFEEQQEHQEPEDEEEQQEARSDIEEEDDETMIKEQQQIEEDSEVTTDNTVAEEYKYASTYKHDKEKWWCQLIFRLPVIYQDIDLNGILREVAAKCVIWETPNIKRAIIYKKDRELILKTEGINMVEMFKYHDLLDLKRLHCNDIHKVAETYGIEAAAKAIVKEVKDVFNVYGINVDPRHLSLIADYMTSNGFFEPLSRKGMESSTSCLQQMSFESATQFLKVAVAKGKTDDLQNPSACLMTGKPNSLGTGSFALLQKLPNLRFTN